MWIARDENNHLNLFYRKPILEDYGGHIGKGWVSNIRGKVFNKSYEEHYGRDTFTRDSWVDNIELNDILYPEITFENSPKELIVKSTSTTLKT